MDKENLPILMEKNKLENLKMVNLSAIEFPIK